MLSNAANLGTCLYIFRALATEDSRYRQQIRYDYDVSHQINNLKRKTPAFARSVQSAGRLSLVRRKPYRSSSVPVCGKEKLCSYVVEIVEIIEIIEKGVLGQEVEQKSCTQSQHSLQGQEWSRTPDNTIRRTRQPKGAFADFFGENGSRRK